MAQDLLVVAVEVVAAVDPLLQAAVAEDYLEAVGRAVEYEQL